MSLKRCQGTNYISGKEVTKHAVIASWGFVEREEAPIYQEAADLISSFVEKFFPSPSRPDITKTTSMSKHSKCSSSRHSKWALKHALRCQEKHEGGLGGGTLGECMGAAPVSSKAVLCTLLTRSRWTHYPWQVHQNGSRQPRRERTLEEFHTYRCFCFWPYTFTWLRKKPTLTPWPPF